MPQRDAKEHAGASGLPRLPVAELESAVLDQLRAILRAPNLLGNMLPQAIELDPTLDEAKITVAMTRLDAIWDQLLPAEQTRIVKLLVEKVIRLSQRPRSAAARQRHRTPSAGAAPRAGRAN